VGAKRIRYSLSGRRRGISRVAVLFASLTLVLGASGCGGGDDATAESEKAADAEILGGAFERELTAIDAYTLGLGLLRGQALALARELRGQDQEHVDALTKTMRGLGAPVEAEAAELESPGRNRVAALDLAYEQENAALAYYLDAVRHLQTTAPRALSASLAASHAQHLVLLRQALGVPLTMAAPEVFEPGDAPPPKPADGPQSRHIDRFGSHRPKKSR
jgi:rubrerythrin